MEPSGLRVTTAGDARGDRAVGTWDDARRQPGRGRWSVRPNGRFGQSTSLIGEEQARPDDGRDLERLAQPGRQRRDDLLRAAGAELRVEPGARGEHGRWTGFGHADIDQQRAQVVGDDRVPFRTFARDPRGGQQIRAGLRQAGTVDARELDPVVGGRDPPSERRPGQPDVLQVDEPPAVGQHGRQGLADLPGRPAFRQHEVDQLAVRGHPDGEWRPERDPRPGRWSLAAGQWKPGRHDGRLPALGQLTLGLGGGVGRASEHEPPALARRCGGRRGGRIVGHVW